MAIQDDNTILNKGDLKAYHEKIAPMLGGTFMVSTNNSDYYSTDEKMVGVWTDGKPIYQKTWTNIDISGMIDGTNHNIIDITSLNADSTIKVEAIAHQLTSGQKYDYTNTFFNPAPTPDGETLKVNVWRRAENYIGFNATDLHITSVDVTFCYTKTTDTAGSATTTPGAYDINFPNTWPTNQEIYFGNGLYGMRKAGTAAANNLQSGIVLVSNVSKTACCYNKGGMIDMSGTNGTNWYDINSGWDNKGNQRQFNPLITNTNQTLKFYCQDNQDYTTQNIQYNIWFTYTK